MKWNELAEQQCSISRSLAVIGDRWTLLVLSDLFLGAKRFETIRERLEISRTILTDRLNLLEREGVLRRVEYQERPTRYEYRLTNKGLELYPVIMTIVHWGDRHYADEGNPPIIHTHRACGKDFAPVLTCSECHEPVKAVEASARKRPDAPNLPPVMRGPV